MKKEIKHSLLVLVIFTILTGVLYPIFMTALSRLFFSYRAGGSIIIREGKSVGSELIGQNFRNPEYFHGRPSAVGYDASNSGGSNLGPSSAALIGRTRRNAEIFRLENGLSIDQKVPADIVLESASGLDPHISLEAALLQISRISRMRNLPGKTVYAAVKKYTEVPMFGFLGRTRVNVLKLNIYLDEIQSGKNHE